MNNFNDLLPEEREPQHEELISLLKRAYRKPALLSPTNQEQVIERVRERLLQMGLEDSHNEDLPESQTGVLNSTPHKAVSPARIPQRDRRRFRLIALLAAALVITALLVAPLFLLRSSLIGGTGGTNEYPTLTLSSNAASAGSTVHVTLTHFSPLTHVALTHDIQEPISINGNSSITTDAQGSATFSLGIDTTWGPGFHLIVAEDVSTRSTASANLQITGEGPTHPAHLLLDTTPLAMGADVVGTNTIRPFTLANSGGGSISWSANSDTSWLLIAPSQGIFSQQEVISLAVQRVDLKPGDYHGSITISSNVSAPQHIEVDMTVKPLPPNAGPVLALSPALLSFTATDGGPDPSAQSLTMSSPGSRLLNWSLAINAPATSTTQAFSIQEQGSACRWLHVTPLSGTMAPGTSRVLNVSVQSQCLLPGTYQGTLKFMGAGANNVTQTVNVSLTVQPHCGLVTSTGYLGFTLVQGQNTVANQTLSLNTTASCAGAPLSWTSTSSASWLVIPARGQLKDTATTLVPVNIHANSLAPGIYSGNIIFVMGQSTLTVMVQLTVQAASPFVSPIMGASPLSLNFSNTQGQPSPTGQMVTISNNGRSPLSWHVMATPLPSFVWLAASPVGGTIAPGQAGQVTINVNTAPLTPGNYVGQITLVGMDARGNPAPGSPQTIVVNLVMQPPCTMSPPSSSAFSFSAVQGATANPAAQTVLFTGTGSCVWPVSWTARVALTARWLTLSTPRKGMILGTGQSGSLGVGVNITGLSAGTYSTNVTIAATDASGMAVQGSAQTLAVTLTVLPPCVLSPPAPANLAFTANQGQATSTVQNVTFGESGTCSRPVIWMATGDSNSSSWLVLSAKSGTDSSGSGSVLGVNVNATTLLPGNYSGTITIAATDTTGAPVSGSGQTVTVTLTVTATLSGSVVACPGSIPPICTTPQALPGATVTLMSGSTTVATTTADASGNYSFSGIAFGLYAISAAGYDASKNHYVGTASLTLKGNTSNVTIQAFPG
jgi:hypothetical protein